MIVWIVQEDDYECQGVVAVFSDEETAKTFVADHNKNEDNSRWFLPYTYDGFEVV